MNSRRTFLRHLAVSVSAPIAIGSKAFAQAPPPPEKVKEDDPVAVAFGYKEDTTKVDKMKYPQHKDEQVCADCALMVPNSAKDGYVQCTAFQTKLVNAKGWCMAYVKKPA